jgi:hypothetical protein
MKMNLPLHTPKDRVQGLVILLSCLLVILACSAPTGGGTPPVNSAQQTLDALDAKATIRAEMNATQAAEVKEKATETNPPEKLATYTLQPTYTPYPTFTEVPPAAPTNQPPPTVQASPTVEVAPTVQQVDIKTKIRSANILVYEDIRGYPALLPRVKQAIDTMDFSGGKIVQVGDAVGNFMIELNSPTKWDLIIVAAEARSGVRGEFWDMILKQVNRNVALVAEVWYIDKTYYDKLDNLMMKCGITLQKNWVRPVNFQPLNYSIYWLDSTHPLFSIYNTVPPLITPNIYWMDDAGDIIKLASGSGDAVLLAGLQPNERSSYGVLASCLQGRMIMQTFSTHDYQQSKTVALWQNYIYYTLENHFKTAP